MKNLPTGTITLLMTDVEGSTRLWEAAPEAMRQALIRHDAIVTGTIDGHHGAVVRSRGEGDSFFGAFARASDAVAAAEIIQQTLVAEPWCTPFPIRVRIAVHTGEAELREGEYYGPEVNRCARLRLLTHGGQTLISEVTANLLRRSLPPHSLLRPLGAHRLKDIQQPERVFELVQQAPQRRPASQRALTSLRGLTLAPHLKGAVVAGGLLVGLIFAIVIVTGQSTPRDAVPVAGGRPGPMTPPGPAHGRLPRLQSFAAHREGIRLRLSTPEGTVQEGQAIVLVIHLENPAAEDRQMTFPENLLVDLYVRGTKGPDAGRDVYRWSEGQVIVVKPYAVAWTPGQDRTFSLSWTPPSRGALSGQTHAEYRIVAVMKTDDPIETWLDLLIGTP